MVVVQQAAIILALGLPAPAYYYFAFHLSSVDSLLSAGAAWTLLYIPIGFVTAAMAACFGVFLLWKLYFDRDRGFFVVGSRVAFLHPLYWSTPIRDIKAVELIDKTFGWRKLPTLDFCLGNGDHKYLPVRMLAGEPKDVARLVAAMAGKALAV